MTQIVRMYYVLTPCVSYAEVGPGKCVGGGANKKNLHCTSCTRPYLECERCR